MLTLEEYRKLPIARGVNGDVSRAVGLAVDVEE